MISYIHKHVFHVIPFIFGTYVFALVHATWHLYVLVGLHSDNPKSACPDPEAWTLVKFLLLIRVAQQKHEDLIADPPDLSLLTGS